MRYAQLSCTEFYPCYLQQCHSIDLFSYRTPGHDQKRHMNVICHRSMSQVWSSFCSEVLMVLALKFFPETQHGVRGPSGVVYDRARYFEKNCFTPKMEKIAQVQGSFSVQESSVFSSILYFFINLIYNESLYYFNSCTLEQISYLENFGFLRYGPKCSWPIRLQDFSINARTLELAVFHKEINEINWFLVCPSNTFLRKGSLGFSDFLLDGR